MLSESTWLPPSDPFQSRAERWKVKNESWRHRIHYSHGSTSNQCHLERFSTDHWYQRGRYISSWRHHMESSSHSLFPSLRCEVVKVINKESFSEHGDGDAQESWINACACRSASVETIFWSAREAVITLNKLDWVEEICTEVAWFAERSATRWGSPYGSTLAIKMAR